MKMIVAVDNQWGIGKNGDLLLSIPDDMRFFREKTRRAVLVMGYNTLISFPNSKPLPGRMNIVLNDAEGCVVPGTVVCGSIEQLFGVLRDMNSDDVFVIGGGSIYRQLLPYCDTAYITKMRFDGGADTFIPDLDELDNWSVADESDIMVFEGIKYSFAEYRNSSPASVGFSGRNIDMPKYFVREAPAEQNGQGACARPLGGGVGADDVKDYLSKDRLTFEEYLLGRGLLSKQ